MVATFVIGLREGLEAALIVGIIAAFLKRCGQSLRPMWLGVILAIIISILVGVALELVQQALPQRQQEGMETVIGAIAVVFVTGMVLWMRDHARNLKGDLEGQADDALATGTARAMAIMAFLAVLKEGFESAVFLLATFQASSSVGAAALGAVLGILVSVGIGYGIYTGGVRINLGKFFQITGPFLVLVAAGLVISGLRTAHEAGWILIGQQRTLDLSWLAPNGTIRAALITGVLGIPADPRLIEVLGWLAYFVPMMIIVLLPARLRPTGAARVRALAGGAVALAAAALALALFVPLPALQAPEAQARTAGGETLAFAQRDDGSATLSVTDASGKTAEYGFAAEDGQPTGASGTLQWRTEKKEPAAKQTITLAQLAELNGGRLPVGINVDRQPGPFAATVDATDAIDATTYEGGLLGGGVTRTGTAALSGGGLSSPRTVSLSGGGASIDQDTAKAAQQQLQQTQQARAERLLWKMWLPIAAGLTAIALAVQAQLAHRRLTTPTEPAQPAHRKETP
ncbi:ferrous iron transporter [Brevibacterium sp. 5221]|uniref:Ferrous iron transporter n=1 Tax=Brevibacterium rongguiense TaxID=2695267 RepID=A0A6N9H6F8_9MICO|nr:iron uptake transporter permease EfeU [Brevibacterium rongguiense]MYM19336.1 ferrous iron transporter [Brevibacterium rongguiense]